MSHITKVQIEFKDLTALQAAVESIGGQWIGQSTQALYSGEVTGIAFKLPTWQFPCVLGADGSLYYDNYNGRWGADSVLDSLKVEYALEAASAAAQAQGWYCERQSDSVVIYHPDGGTITVDVSGAVDASGFLGSDCVSACSPIEGALGSKSERTLKAEFYQNEQGLLNIERGE